MVRLGVQGARLSVKADRLGNTRNKAKGYKQNGWGTSSKAGGKRRMAVGTSISGNFSENTKLFLEVC